MEKKFKRAYIVRFIISIIVGIFGILKIFNIISEALFDDLFNYSMMIILIIGLVIESMFIDLYNQRKKTENKIEDDKNLSNAYSNSEEELDDDIKEEVERIKQLMDEEGLEYLTEEDHERFKRNV